MSEATADSSASDGETTTTTTTCPTFKKVIGHVLSYNENSHPWKALVHQDIIEIDSFLALEEEDIKALTYENESSSAPYSRPSQKADLFKALGSF